MSVYVAMSVLGQHGLQQFFLCYEHAFGGASVGISLLFPWTSGVGYPDPLKTNKEQLITNYYVFLGMRNVPFLPIVQDLLMSCGVLLTLRHTPSSSVDG